MSRRAAGRAAGRPVRAAVLTGLLTVLPGALGTTSAAAAPARWDDADRPVQITLGRLEPRTVTPGATIVVAGTLVNDSDDTFTDLAVRLQRGDGLASRRALAADAADPDQATTASGAFLPVPGELDPGDSLTFTYTTTAAALELPEDGVFPALVNVNGTRDGGAAERIGELSTYLVAQPAAPTSRTTVAWLWPVTERPHRNAAGEFADDELATAVAPDGRLDRALAVLEQLPPPPPGAPVAVPVTLAVDPALLEELSLMAAGPYTVGSGDDAAEGSGTADAADLLERLRALAAVHPVVVLPYADADADALLSVGLDDVLLRTLPGTAEGTASQPVRPGTGPTGAGAAVVRDVLDVEPVTDIAWPAGGTAAPGTLEVLAAGGVTEVVLADSALTDGDRAVGWRSGTVAAARSTLATDDGDLSVLVADVALAEVVAAAGTDPDGDRLAEQRYLAELGVLTDQLAGEEPAAVQTVLVVPPRLVDADPRWASAMIGDTVTEPWLAAGSVPGLAAGPASDAGDLVPADPVPADHAGSDTDPADPVPLDRAALSEVAETAAVRDDFAAAVVGDPATVLAGYDAALARATSAAWRTDPTGFTGAVADLTGTVADLRDRVTLLAPADGTYSLASDDAPLVLTVQNDLPFAVDARLDLRARGSVGLDAEDVGVIRLEPQSRTTIQVPTKVRKSGGFAVTAALTTPAGGPLGESVQLQVRSTAYGSVTLAITLGAGALLGLLFLRRLVRFLLARRRPAVEPAEPITVPPVRSPV